MLACSDAPSSAKAAPNCANAEPLKRKEKKEKKTDCRTLSSLFCLNSGCENHKRHNPFNGQPVSQEGLTRAPGARVGYACAVPPSTGRKSSSVLKAAQIEGRHQKTELSKMLLNSLDTNAAAPSTGLSHLNQPSEVAQWQDAWTAPCSRRHEAG